MAGPWDNLMKRLVGAHPGHFAQWLVPNANFVQALDIELKAQSLYADALLQIQGAEERELLHVEFQTGADSEMEVRLLEYNVLASHQYERCPVTSYVIYLRKGTTVAKSPYLRKGADSKAVHRFYFRVIKLWEIPAEVIVQLGWIGLVPLLTLTKGGKRPEVVKVMINTLVEAGETDLLAMAQIAGGLVFKTGTEQQWFKRRFGMFQDIMRESWVYQEISQEGLEKGLEQGLKKGLEQGLEKGREEERRREVQRQRQAIMSFVEARFAELVEMAKQHTDAITDPEVLQTLTLKLFAAQTVEEAQRFLFEVGKH